MSIRRNTPCDTDGICPYDAEYNCDCAYWCGADEPEDIPEICEDEEDEPRSLEFKTYPLEIDDEVIEVYFEKYEYQNGRLALMLLTYEDGDQYCDATKNISDLPISNQNCAFLNCNDEPWLQKWLVDLGIAKPTGHCAGRYYPEYEFDADFLASL